MSPGAHSRLHLVSLFVAMFAGMFAGFFAGAGIITSFGGGPEWVGAIGTAVGITVAVLAADTVVRWFVRAGCPNCGGLMRCRIRAARATPVAWYRCPACGATACPSHEFWNRAFRRLNIPCRIPSIEDPDPSRREPRSDYQSGNNAP